MRKLSSLVLTVFAISLLVPAIALAGQDYSLEYIQTVGDHFQASYQEVNSLIQPGLTAEELAPVYLIAREAKVPATEVAAKKIAGSSWSDIANEYQVLNNTFFVSLGTNANPKPNSDCEKSLARFYNTPELEWANIVFEDAEIVNLCNLQMIAKEHRFAPSFVIRRRANGNDFMTINHDVALTKADDDAKRLAYRNKNK